MHDDNVVVQFCMNLNHLAPVAQMSVKSYVTLSPNYPVMWNFM